MKKKKNTWYLEKENLNISKSLITPRENRKQVEE